MASCVRHIEFLKLTKEFGNVLLCSRSCMKFSHASSRNLHLETRNTKTTANIFSNAYLTNSLALSPAKSIKNMESRSTCLQVITPSCQNSNDDIQQFLDKQNLYIKSIRKLEISDDDIVSSHKCSECRNHGKYVSYKDIKCLGLSNHHKELLLLYKLPEQLEKLYITESANKKANLQSDKSGRPSPEQLQNIHDNLIEFLPKLFSSTQDYRIYHKDFIFQNNIKGITTKGITQYVAYLSKIRILGHITYAYIKLDLLKVTKHPEEGTIKIRWRIPTVSNFKVFFGFWNLRFWKINQIKSEAPSIDGFSIFYVGSDGLIHKHICDKMMPDDNVELAKPNKLGVKLAMLFGALVPQTPFSIGSVLSVQKQS